MILPGIVVLCLSGRGGGGCIQGVLGCVVVLYWYVMVITLVFLLCIIVVYMWQPCINHHHTPHVSHPHHLLTHTLPIQPTYTTHIHP